MKRRAASWWTAAWIAAVAVAAGVRIWNALFGPLFYGYDEWAHVSYIFFLDLYRSLPYADQGWSYFHPPLYYALGWAIAQISSAESLIRGLGLLGAAASLGTAALAALVVRRWLEGPPALAWLAFVAVALLPVHVYTSVMVGNEMLACFVASSALTCFLMNEHRESPRLGLDLLTGLLAGLAALTKISGITVLGSIGLSLLLVHFLRERRSSSAQLATRLAAVGGVAIVIAGPFYLRTFVEYGTPFQLSRDFPPMLGFELQQPPGERSWRDFVSVPPRLFVEPGYDTPHMQRSVWGNLYLNMWCDTYGVSQIPITGWDSPKPRGQTITRLFAVLGIGPTLLALLGALLSAQAARRRRSSADVTLLIVSASSLLSFVVFAVQVPTWAAVKASYLLALSLPYGFFVARAALALWQRKHGYVWIAVLPVSAAALATAFVFTSGAALEMRQDKREMSGVHLLFGEYDRSRAGWKRAAARSGSVGRVVSDGLAAAELLSGNANAARRLYRRTLRQPLEDEPYRANRLAVAAALDGDAAAASRLLEQPWAAAYPELLVNRGALRLASGDARAAEAELRRAAQLVPDLVPAWTNLATALDAQGRSEEAQAARDEASAAAARAPRGFPYGVGNGDLSAVGGNQRWMLLASRNGELTLWKPERARGAPENPHLTISFGDQTAKP